MSLLSCPFSPLSISIFPPSNSKASSPYLSLSPTLSSHHPILRRLHPTFLSIPQCLPTIQFKGVFTLPPSISHNVFPPSNSKASSPYLSLSPTLSSHHPILRRLHPTSYLSHNVFPPSNSQASSPYLPLYPTMSSHYPVQRRLHPTSISIPQCLPAIQFKGVFTPASVTLQSTFIYSQCTNSIFILRLQNIIHSTYTFNSRVSSLLTILTIVVSFIIISHIFGLFLIYSALI